MKFLWQLEDGTCVEARFSTLGKETVRVDGTALLSTRSWKMQRDLEFRLAGGRRAVVSVRPQYVVKLNARLYVDGRLYARTTGRPLLCGDCGREVCPNDRFCDACGHLLPPVKQRLQLGDVRDATKVMWTLALLFIVVGVVGYYFLSREATEVLARLAGMDANDILPMGDAGYTVSQLRDKLTLEPRGTLVSHLMMALIMAGLASWGRTSPLPAVMMAIACYAAAVVLKGMADPETILQGVMLKVLVIAYLTKGIKAALALHVARA
ncbi:MAG TPA: zinc ribbon domain-containing protein [Terriglobales bacterium]|nr:zinc ribbon domain-containing protein [Terriglobales bacterium]